MDFNILQMLIVTQLFKTIPILLCEPNFHCRVHKSPSLEPVACQINAVDGLTIAYFSTRFEIPKCKAVTVQDWTGPACYRSLKFPDFKTVGK